MDASLFWMVITDSLELARTDNCEFGVAVPMPTLLPETKIGELPIVEAPVKTETVLVVPLPVTVCAVALAAINPRPNAIQLTCLRIMQHPLCSANELSVRL